MIIPFQCGCALCGVERAENEPVFRPYQLGRFVGKLCPTCFGVIEGAMTWAVQRRMHELALQRRKGA